MQKVRLIFKYEQTDELYLEVELSAEFDITKELLAIGAEVMRFAEQRGVSNRIYSVLHLVER